MVLKVPVYVFNYTCGVSVVNFQKVLGQRDMHDQTCFRQFERQVASMFGSFIYIS